MAVLGAWRDVYFYASMNGIDYLCVSKNSLVQSDGVLGVNVVALAMQIGFFYYRHIDE